MLDYFVLATNVNVFIAFVNYWLTLGYFPIITYYKNYWKNKRIVLLYCFINYVKLKI